MKQERKEMNGKMNEHHNAISDPTQKKRDAWAQFFEKTRNNIPIFFQMTILLVIVTLKVRMSGKRDVWCSVVE